MKKLSELFFQKCMKSREAFADLQVSEPISVLYIYKLFQEVLLLCS